MGAREGKIEFSSEVERKVKEKRLEATDSSSRTARTSKVDTHSCQTCFNRPGVTSQRNARILLLLKERAQRERTLRVEKVLSGSLIQFGTCLCCLLVALAAHISRRQSPPSPSTSSTPALPPVPSPTAFLSSSTLAFSTETIKAARPSSPYSSRSTVPPAFETAL